MSVQEDVAAPAAPRGGFMFGELLVAAFLLVIAISSVTALMYSVGRQPRNRTVDCTAKASAVLAECAKSSQAKASPRKSESAARMLVSGCATRTESQVKECTDSVTAARASEGTTLRSRTDSASLELLPKRPKRAARPDLGFVR